MMKVIVAFSAILAIGLFALGSWHWSEKRAEQLRWEDLASHQPLAPGVFDVSMVAGLPDTVQRFFRFAIRPGTPLYTVAEISMDGEFSLGDKSKPDYMPMTAEQILAAPYGFVWKVRAGNTVWVTGSDGAVNGTSWSRFWLWGIAPVARAGTNEDHARAAFGRYVAESVFWTPAALLPGDNVRWQAIDDATARVIMTHRGLAQAVDLSIGANGEPVKVVFQRWSDANPERVFQLQPFGGYLWDYRDFGGFRLPARIEAGNFFETDDYFPFFKATVTAIRFPAASED